jgi:hypothetical protein
MLLLMKTLEIALQYCRTPTAASKPSFRQSLLNAEKRNSERDPILKHEKDET